MTTTTKKPRGFAALSPEARAEVAKKGGAAVPSDRRSFHTQPGLASRAGAKGGATSRKPPRKPVADAS